MEGGKMKKLQFVRIENGKRTALAEWLDVEKGDLDLSRICYNYMEGFLMAIDTMTQYDYQRPCSMAMDGFRAWSHKSNIEYRFEWDDGEIVTLRK